MSYILKVLGEIRISWEVVRRNEDERFLKNQCTLKLEIRIKFYNKPEAI